VAPLGLPAYPDHITITGFPPDKIAYITHYCTGDMIDDTLAVPFFSFSFCFQSAKSPKVGGDSFEKY